MPARRPCGAEELQQHALHQRDTVEQADVGRARPSVGAPSAGAIMRLEGGDAIRV
jgi:hypothetical protein